MRGPLDRHTFDVACAGCKIENPKTLGWLKAHNQFICEGCGKNIDIDKSRFTAGVDEIDKAFRNLTKTIQDLNKSLSRQMRASAPGRFGRAKSQVSSTKDHSAGRD